MIIHNRTGKVLFTVEEISCRHCGEVKLAPGFASELAALRASFGEPMKVNCCCRCPDHNAAVGGHWRSLHLIREGRVQGSCAVDVHVPDPQYRTALAMQALSLGWSVGVYKTFLHLDKREYAGLPQRLFRGDH